MPILKAIVLKVRDPTWTLPDDALSCIHGLSITRPAPIGWRGVVT